jgi:uncharacterized Zn finger protein (UPF0148 family)
MASNYCPKCGSLITVIRTPGEIVTCPSCGALIKTRQETESTPARPENGKPRVEKYVSRPYIPPKKYAALRTIETVFRFFGWLAVVVALGLGFLLFIWIRVLGPLAFVLAITVLFAGAFTLLVCLAIAESIIVTVDIEENTRGTKYLLESMRKYLLTTKEK